MRKARFTEHHIIFLLGSVEAGRIVKDVYREAGILSSRKVLQRNFCMSDITLI